MLGRRVDAFANRDTKVSKSDGNTMTQIHVEGEQGGRTLEDADDRTGDEVVRGQYYAAITANVARDEVKGVKRMMKERVWAEEVRPVGVEELKSAAMNGNEEVTEYFGRGGAPSKRGMPSNNLQEKEREVRVAGDELLYFCPTLDALAQAVNDDSAMGDARKANVGEQPYTRLLAASLVTVEAEELSNDCGLGGYDVRSL